MVRNLRSDSRVGSRANVEIRCLEGWRWIRSRQAYPWLLETGPLACAIACLWGKMACFSLGLRSVWWGQQESIGDWIRTHPDIFTATLSILLLLFGLTLLLPRVWRFLILLSLDVLLTLMLLADTVHVNYYGDVPSAVSLLNLPMLPSVTPVVVKELKPVYVVYFFDIIAGILLLPRYLRACRRVKPLNYRHRLCFCSGMIVCGLLLAVPATRSVRQDPNGLLAYGNLQRDVCATIGLLPYHLADAIIHACSGKKVVDSLDRQRVSRFLEDQGKQRGSPSKLFGVAHRKT